LVGDTQFNFCGEIIHKFNKGNDRVDRESALVQLAGEAIYWIWLFVKDKDFEEICVLVKTKALVMVEYEVATERELENAEKAD
jgi:hypothetical protein